MSRQRLGAIFAGLALAFGALTPTWTSSDNVALDQYTHGPDLLAAPTPSRSTIRPEDLGTRHREVAVEAPLSSPSAASAPTELAFAADCGSPPLAPDEYRDALSTAGSEWAVGDLMERIELDAERTAWIFGDTYRGEVNANQSLEPGWTLVNSALMVQMNGCFEVIPGFGNQSWIPSVDKDVRLWPQEALVVDDELLMFAGNIVSDPGKPPGLAFRQVGGTIAVYDLESLNAPRTSIVDVPNVRGNPFGWGVLIHEDNIYMYAHEEPTGTFVARSRIGEVLDTAKWTFWDGAGWVGDPDAAASIAPYRLRVFASGDGFGAAAVPFLDPELHVFTSPSPEGPWALVDVVSLDAVRPTTRTYAYEPLLVTADNKGMVFAVNFLPTDPWEVLDDVRLYGPRFIEVGLPPSSEEPG